MSHVPTVARPPSRHPDLRTAGVRAEEAVSRARQVVAASRHLVDQARSIRRDGAGTQMLRFFVLDGEVDGIPVKGRWLAGSLLATQRLRQRAELLVQLEERFEVDLGGTAVPAGLTEPLAALLTLVRACDRIRSVLIGPIGRPLPLRHGKRP